MGSQVEARMTLIFAVKQSCIFAAGFYYCLVSVSDN